MNNWEERSKNFNNIDWVTNEKLLEIIKYAMDLNKNHIVLDAGIGTGILSSYVINDVKEIYGIDSSKSMLGPIKDKRIHKHICDIRRQKCFEDGKFDRVVLRNVLHHCVGYIDEAINECHRVLKPGGKIIISEGVAFNNNCYSDFARIVTLHENRLIFTEEDMARWIHRFFDVKGRSIILRKQSIDNWINNSFDDFQLRKRIKEAHRNTSSAFKGFVDFHEEGEDIFINMKVFIISGTKNE